MKATNIDYFCACCVNSVYVEVIFILIIHVILALFYLLLCNFDFDNSTLDADSRNLSEAPAALVHLMLCTRAMPICASVLQRLVITTTMPLTKVGQLCCESGCTGRDIAARGGEVESDDSPRESRASPIRRLLPCYIRMSSSGTIFFWLMSHEKSTWLRTFISEIRMKIIASLLYSSHLSFTSMIRSMSLRIRRQF